jgi:hypothetical protein
MTCIGYNSISPVPVNWGLLTTLLHPSGESVQSWPHSLDFVIETLDLEPFILLHASDTFTKSCQGIF